jgi:hypothetical protein
MSASVRQGADEMADLRARKIRTQCGFRAMVNAKIGAS